MTREGPARAAGSSVAGLFAAAARLRPQALCLEQGGRERTYAQVRDRVARTAAVLQARGVGRGDRVAILSRNRTEYLETFLACAWLGAIAACQNWRLAQGELAHCLDLVEPAILVAAPDQAERLQDRAETTLVYGPAWEQALTRAEPVDQPVQLDPEDTFLILYTSGTTGLPKGAMISHRAAIARNAVTRAELGIAAHDAFVAWSPLYHMGGAEYALGTLMSGGAVHVVDGYDAERLLDHIRDTELGWLLLMPGMVGRLADLLEERGITARSIRCCGVMADLVPPADLARITRLLDAPYVNTFGSTETGNPPASAGLLPIGQQPQSLAKQQSAFCEVRLVDEDDHDVPDGEPGELCMRGPTLFSGYWRNPQANERDFRGGWFHMGDVFVRNPDGTLTFVDRRKYMIKSGGENIYPAEIERVLLADARVQDAAVVKRPDPTWGEVPVAFVALRDHGSGDASPPSAQELIDLCRAELASYKKPKAVYFIDHSDFPRSASGKIQRHALEHRLPTQDPQEAS